MGPHPSVSPSSSPSLNPAQMRKLETVVNYVQPELTKDREFMLSFTPDQVDRLDKLHTRIADAKNQNARKFIREWNAQQRRSLKGFVPPAHEQLTFAPKEVWDVLSLRAQMVGIMMEASGKGTEAPALMDSDDRKGAQEEMEQIMERLEERSEDLFDRLDVYQDDLDEIKTISMYKDVKYINANLHKFDTALKTLEGMPDGPEKELTRNNLLRWKRTALLMKEINPLHAKQVDAYAQKNYSMEKPLKFVIGAIASVLAIMAIITLIKKKGQTTETDLLITGAYAATAIAALGLYKGKDSELTKISQRTLFTIKDPKLQLALKKVGVDDTRAALPALQQYFDHLDDDQRKEYLPKLHPTKVEQTIKDIAKDLTGAEKVAFEKAFARRGMDPQHSSAILTRLFHDEIWKEETLSHYTAILGMKDVIATIAKAAAPKSKSQEPEAGFQYRTS